MKRPRSCLHKLIVDAFKTHLDGANTARIGFTRLHPGWHSLHRVNVLDVRQAAIMDDLKWAWGGAYRVYTDGSDTDGCVEAAVVLYAPGRRRPRVLRSYRSASIRTQYMRRRSWGLSWAPDCSGQRPGLPRRHPSRRTTSLQYRLPHGVGFVQENTPAR